MSSKTPEYIHVLLDEYDFWIFNDNLTDLYSQGVLRRSKIVYIVQARPGHVIPWEELYGSELKRPNR